MLYELFTSDLELFASNVVERRIANDDDISYDTADHGSRFDRHYFSDQLFGSSFSGEAAASWRQRASREF
jgi:hypothetical protein